MSNEPARNVAGSKPSILDGVAAETQGRGGWFGREGFAPTKATTILGPSPLPDSVMVARVTLNHLV